MHHNACEGLLTAYSWSLRMWVDRNVPCDFFICWQISVRSVHKLFLRFNYLWRRRSGLVPVLYGSLIKLVNQMNPLHIIHKLNIAILHLRALTTSLKPFLSFDVMHHNNLSCIFTYLLRTCCIRRSLKSGPLRTAFAQVIHYIVRLGPKWF